MGRPDLRTASQFGQGHLKGSLNIGLEFHLFNLDRFFISGQLIYLVAQTRNLQSD